MYKYATASPPLNSWGRGHSEYFVIVWEKIMTWAGVNCALFALLRSCQGRLNETNTNIQHFEISDWSPMTKDWYIIGCEGWHSLGCALNLLVLFTVVAYCPKSTRRLNQSYIYVQCVLYVWWINLKLALLRNWTTIIGVNLAF